MSTSSCRPAGATARWTLFAAASPAIGGGHLARCRHLAKELDGRGVRANVIELPDPKAPSPKRGSSGCAARSDPLQRALRSSDVVVIDAPDAVLENVAIGPDHNALVVVFRMYGVRPGSHRFEDVSLTPSFDAPAMREYGIGRGRELTGRDLILVRPTCFATPTAQKDEPPRVLVTFGSADPLGLTARTCEAIAPLRFRFPVTVVAGALNPSASDIHATYGAEFDVVDQSEIDFDDLLKRSTVAVINGGLTRYECIAASTPFVALSLDAKQAAFTEAVVRAGFGRHVGLAAEVELATLRSSVVALVTDDELEAMRRRAATMLDVGAAGALIDRLHGWAQEKGRRPI